MKKKTVFKISFVVIFLLVNAGMLLAADSKDHIVGTWHFNAPDAPYEYSTGDIVITKTDGKYKGEIVFSEYYKLETEDFKVQKNVISFKAYVEGDVVYFKGTIKGKKLTGKASYSEGTLNVTADKVEKKKLKL